VQADVQDGRVLLKDVLRAVPVMDIPVKDRDPFDPMPVLRISRPYRDVVEQAETHRRVGLGMVPGRAHCAKR
jgi:hypothetical protein